MKDPVWRLCHLLTMLLQISSLTMGDMISEVSLVLGWYFLLIISKCGGSKRSCLARYYLTNQRSKVCNEKPKWSEMLVLMRLRWWMSQDRHLEFKQCQEIVKLWSHSSVPPNKFYARPFLPTLQAWLFALSQSMDHYTKQDAFNTYHTIQRLFSSCIAI